MMQAWVLAAVVVLQVEVVLLVLVTLQIQMHIGQRLWRCHQGAAMMMWACLMRRRLNQ